jgi:hypothetical protein
MLEAAWHDQLIKALYKDAPQFIGAREQRRRDVMGRRICHGATLVESHLNGLKRLPAFRAARECLSSRASEPLRPFDVASAF